MFSKSSQFHWTWLKGTFIRIIYDYDVLKYPFESPFGHHPSRSIWVLQVLKFWIKLVKKVYTLYKYLMGTFVFFNFIKKNSNWTFEQCHLSIKNILKITMFSGSSFIPKPFAFWMGCILAFFFFFLVAFEGIKYVSTLNLDLVFPMWKFKWCLIPIWWVKEQF